MPTTCVCSGLDEIRVSCGRSSSISMDWNLDPIHWSKYTVTEWALGLHGALLLRPKLCSSGNESVILVNQNV